MSSGAPVSRVQVPVAGSNTSGTVALQSAQFTSPASASMRPSGKAVTVGYQRPTAIFTPGVDGSKTTAPVASVWSSHARTLPLGIRFMWIATRGQSRTCDQSPTTAGSVDVLLVTVMATPDDTVWLPAPSRARAVRVCDPFVAVTVFHGVEYGAVVISGASGAPSRKNWTPATVPELSEASAVTVTVPVRFAPGAGAVIATDGGVTSCAAVLNET